MRRTFTVLTIFILVIALSVPALSWETLPESAEPIITEWQPRFIYYSSGLNVWYSRNRSLSGNDFQTNSDNFLSTSILLTDTSGVPTYTFLNNTTYYLDFTYKANNALTEWLDFSTNPNIWQFVKGTDISSIYGDITSDQVTVPQPDISIMFSLSSMCTDISITNTNVDLLTVRIRVAFRTNSQVESLNLSALYIPISAISENVGNFTINQFAGWTDPDGGTFDQVVVEGLLNINNTLEDINNSVELFRQDVNSNLVGDPSDYPDNSGVGDAASDLIGKEEEIQDLIYTPVTMPDGTVVNVDSNTINNFKEYIYNTYDPIDYDSSVGSELTKIFEVFMPYVGVVVFLNLMLAAVLAFLRGRANA